MGPFGTDAYFYCAGSPYQHTRQLGILAVARSRQQPHDRQVRIGEVATALYTVTNESARPTSGQAAYNVSPPTTGGYFEKINCFCFSQQDLKPGERRELSVVFYVDPKLALDAEQDGLNTITLSYSFYPVRPPAGSPVAASGPAARNERF